jgi:hypothetical protein
MSSSLTVEANTSEAARASIGISAEASKGGRAAKPHAGGVQYSIRTCGLSLDSHPGCAWSNAHRLEIPVEGFAKYEAIFHVRQLDSLRMRVVRLA